MTRATGKGEGSQMSAETRSTEPFEKRREPKPDGRYIIYYTFDGAEQPERTVAAEEAAPQPSGERRDV